MSKYIEVLKKCSIFNGFKDEEITNILNFVEHKIINFTKGQNIYSVGDNIRTICILLDGRANIQKVDFDGNLNIISNIKPSEIFAEAFVYANIQKIPVNVVCTEECKVLMISPNNINSLIKKDIELFLKLNNNMLNAMSKRLFYLNKKVEILTKQTIREKVLTYLDSFFEVSNSKIVEIPFNREQLADFLCVNRASLSRELSKMKDEKIIDYHKNVFKKL